MILVFIVIAVLFICLFYILLRQSKHPSGCIGTLMMKLWNKVYLPMTQWGLTFVSSEKFEAILDIGVGNGATSHEIIKFFPSAHVIGIDISTSAIQEATKRYATPNCSFITTSIEATQFSSQSFDLICAFQTHFHWENLDTCLLEVKRLLRPNGMFIISCELAKINYFLPQLKNNTDFNDYLKKLQLQLVEIEQKTNWIFYKIEHSD